MPINKINVERALDWTVEGAADSAETTFTFTNPTTDRTLKFPDGDGVITTEEKATAWAVALGG